MQSAITIRDWISVAAIAVLGLTYGAGLLAQATSAHAANPAAPHICVFSDSSAQKTN